MLKNLMKFISLIIVYSLVFMIINLILPFSDGFKEMNSSSNPFTLIFLLISSAWTCFVICYIIKKSNWNGIKITLSVIGMVFFIQYFMTQIETLLFGHAFEVLTTFDVLNIMIAGLVPIIVIVPLAVKFFQNKSGDNSFEMISIPKIALKLVIIGIIYMFVYFIFGYFVAWQFEELRFFYSGSTVLIGFIDQIMVNFNSNPFIFPFQIFRGILFGIAAVPLLMMFKNNKNYFFISLCLLYLCSAIVLIIPNPLFPDAVRYGHLIEMVSSMFVFALITGFILWGDE